jgi:signal transduction histidine kinase
LRVRDRLLRRALRAPRRTVRLRLTILYALLFLASGVGLLSITYLLVRQAGDVVVGTSSNGASFAVGKRPGSVVIGKLPPSVATTRGRAPGGPLSAQQLKAQAQHDMEVAVGQRNAELNQLLEKSGVALALMTALSVLLGWFFAGRVLRPLRTITERAREISASNLHERVALVGPDDELTQLADTFDDLLGRLEAAFAAQRQFVANAAHELRTPLTRAQTLGEVALGDPAATVDSLRASHGRVLAAGREQERLIEALLTLARSERGLDEREPFDLATVTATMLHARHDETEQRRLYVHATLQPAQTAGDPRLAERLVANLLDNALRYNEPHGRIDVTTTARSGRAVLSVANSGPPIPPGEVDRLFRPFQRLGADRTDQGDGLGLGLSIVQAIATAHQATLTARAQQAGGLEIEVGFPFSNGVPEPTSDRGNHEPREDLKPRTNVV